MHPRWASQKMPALYVAVIGITATNAVVSWLGTYLHCFCSFWNFILNNGSHCELHISLAHLNTSLTTCQCCQVLMCLVTINRTHCTHGNMEGAPLTTKRQGVSWDRWWVLTYPSTHYKYISSFGRQKQDTPMLPHYFFPTHRKEKRRGREERLGIWLTCMKKP